MRVLVVAEYYPRPRDPVLGVWAHRQAVAARDAGAEVRVLVLDRILPPGRSARGGPGRELDGIPVTYVPFLGPWPRSRTYGTWGAWAAPPLRRALARLRRGWAPELVHAHYAVPAGEAALRVAPELPLVISVHGGDVLWAAGLGPRSAAAVGRALGGARLVLANSPGTERRARALGAARTRVLHLAADLQDPVAAADPPVLVSLGHLVARKRHADVLRALPALPEHRYVVVGDGPERPQLEALATRLGVAHRVAFRGQLAPSAARATLPPATAMVLPSTGEAFGVAYVEALAAGVPAVGCAGEDGPEAIAAAGPGLTLVPPGDPDALVAAVRGIAEDAGLRAAARATAERAFTWERCGDDTLAAYADALGR